MNKQASKQTKQTNTKTNKQANKRQAKPVKRTQKRDAKCNLWQKTYNQKKVCCKVTASCKCSMDPGFRQCPHYTGECSFISTVRPIVHTNPSRKRSFSKTLFKPEEYENAGFSFSNSVDEVLRSAHTRGHIGGEAGSSPFVCANLNSYASPSVPTFRCVHNFARLFNFSICN